MEQKRDDITETTNMVGTRAAESYAFHVVVYFYSHYSRSTLVYTGLYWRRFTGTFSISLT